MAQKYVENILASVLEEYVDRFDESSLEIGIWEGDVALTNLTFKQMEWNLSPGINLALEYGHIEKVQIQIPWMELRSGNVSAIVDSCNVVLRVKVVDPTASTDADNTEYAADMAKVLAEELKLLSASPETWMSRAMDSFGSKVLKQIAGGSSLSVDHLKCSILLPTTPKDYLHVQAQFEALDIDPLKDPPTRGNLPPKPKLMLAKDISVRGLKVNVVSEVVQLPSSPLEYEGLFDQFESTDIFLNPIHMLAHLWVHQVGAEESPDEEEYTEVADEGSIDEDGSNSESEDIFCQQWDDLIISFETHLSNLEITPNLRQLVILRDFSTYLFFINLRASVAHLHPSAHAIKGETANNAEDEAYFHIPGSHFVGSSFSVHEASYRSQGSGIVRGFAVKLWWKYAIRSIIFMNRKRKADNNAKKNFERKDAEKLLLRDKGWFVDNELPMMYMRLYQKFITHKLSLLESSHAIIGEGSRKAFTKLDLSFMEKLQKLCSVADLIRYRTCVHKNLQFNGEYQSDLLLAVQDADASFIEEINTEALNNMYPLRGKPKRHRMALDTVGDLSYIKKMDQHLTDVWQESLQKEATTVRLNVNVSLTRFAIVILQTRQVVTLPHQSKENAATADAVNMDTDVDHCDRAFTLALYGINVDLAKSEIRNTLDLAVNIGAVRCFGYGNVELLSCGIEANDWLQHFNAEDEKTRFKDYAIRVCFGSMEKSIMKNVAIVAHGNVNVKTEANRPTNSIDIAHNTITLDVMLVTLSWDHLSMEFLKEMGCAILPHSPLLRPITENESRKEFILRNENNDLTDDEIFALRTNLSSFDIKLRGLSLSISNANIIRASETVNNKYSSERRKSAAAVGKKGQGFTSNHLAILEESLVLKVGAFSIISGDFLEAWVDNDSAATSSTSLDDTNFISFMAAPWDQADNSLRMLTRTFRHPLLDPMVFHLNDFEVFRSVEDPKARATDASKKEKAKILCTPWSFAGILSSCVVPLHRELTDKRLDINFSPMNVSISQDDSIAVIDAVNGILDIFESEVDLNGNDGMLYPDIEPRVSLLANKCALHMNLALSSANIALTRGDESRYPRRTFEHLFDNFGKLVLRRGEQTQVMRTHRKILMCQLQEALPLADGMSNAKNLIDSFIESIKMENNKNKDTSEVLRDAVDDAVDDLFEACAGTPAGKKSQCILDLRLTGLQLTSHKYTYETQFTVQFTSFSCFGGNANLPLLRIHDDSYQNLQLQHAEDEAKAAAAAAAAATGSSSKKDGNYSAKSRKRPSRSDRRERSGKHRVTIEQSLEAFEDHLARSALTVSYTEHENGYNIAWGGVSPKDFFRHKSTIVERNFLDIPPHPRKRVAKLDIVACEISVLLHSEVIPETCAVIVQASEVVGKHMNLLRKRKQNLRYILNNELKSIKKANANKHNNRSDADIDYFSEGVRGGLTYNADLSNFRRSQHKKNRSSKSHKNIMQQFIDCPDSYISVLKSISTSDAHLIVQHTECKVKFFCLRSRNHIELLGSRSQIEKAKGLLSQVLVRGYLARDRGTTSIRCNTRFDAVDLILGHEDDIFALAQVHRGEITLNYNPFTAHVRVTGNLHNLHLHDFSEAGALHPLVLWRSEKLPEEDFMIKFNLAIDIEHNKDDPQKQMLSVELLGMRVSLLSRFFQELAIYLKEKFILSLKAAIAVVDEKADKYASSKDRGGSSAEDASSSSSSSSSDEDVSSSDTDSDEYEQYMVTPTNPIRKFSAKTAPLSRGFVAPAAGASRFQKQPAAFPSENEGNAEDSQEDEVDESWLHWDIRLIDCDIIIPRNSSSNDLIALKVGYAVVNNDKLVGVIKAPTPDELFNGGLPIAREKHLHFDPDLNEWVFSVNERKDDDSFELPLVSDASIDSGSSRSGSHFQSFSPFSAIGGSPVPAYSPPISSREHKASSPVPEYGIRSISPNSRVSKYVSLVDQMNPISPSTAGKSTATKGSKASSNSSGSEKSYSKTRKDSIDGFEFFDACDADESRIDESNASLSFQENDSPKIRVIPPVLREREKEKEVNPREMSKEKEKQLPYTTNRICIDLHQVSIFSSLSGPYQSSTAAGERHLYLDTDESRKYFEIKQDAPVYLVNHARASKASESVQKWRMLTQDYNGDIPFNMFIVVDCMYDGLPNEVTKIMIGDNDSLTPLSLQVTMSEFALLQAIWFDNSFEAPQCFTPSVPFSIPPESTNLPLYGTAAFFKHLKDALIDFEFIIVRAELCLDCFMDADYFGQELPSTRFLRLDQLLELLGQQPALVSECIFHGWNPLFEDGGQGSSNFTGDAASQWSNCCFPLAKVYIEGLVVHVETMMKDRIEDIGMLVGVAAGVVEAFDTRLPRNVNEDPPRALRVAPLDPGSEDAPGGLPKDLSAERVYGYADTSFGLNMTSFDICKAQDSPFKLLIAKTKHYININVGIDGAELNLRNLDFVLLLVDYFALFYQHPGFGHPLKDLVNVAGVDKLPYDCIDTRVFAPRPHISIMQDPKNSASPTLVIETDRGLYYRHMVDSDNSSKIELKLVDAVAVIHKVYCGPELSRGRRGSAGSGRGIRTQLESLCVDFSMHYDAKLNNNDIQVRVEPTFSVDNTDFLKSSDRWKRIFKANGSDYMRSESISRKGLGTRDIRATSLRANQARDSSRRSPSGPSTFIDYNSDYLFMAPAEIHPPKSVYPLDDDKDSKEFATCNIVTSYEDILFSVSMISDFLDDGPVANLSQPSIASTGGPLSVIGGDGEKKKRSNRRSSNFASTPFPKESPVGRSTATNPNIILSAADRERERDALLIDKKKSASIYGVVSLSSLKCIIVDNVLGLHLPLVSVAVKDVRLNACHMRKEKKLKMRRQTTILGADGKEKRVFRTAGGFYSKEKWEDDLSNEQYVDKNGAPLFYTKVYGTMHMWADYFNNLKKCWEPLLEQVKANVIYDKGSRRGEGIVMRVESPIQVNISGAFFRTLNDLIRMFQGVATLPKREDGKTSVETWSAVSGRPVSERIHAGVSGSADKTYTSLKASELAATVLNAPVNSDTHFHLQSKPMNHGDVSYRNPAPMRRNSRNMTMCNYRNSFVHHSQSPIRGEYGGRSSTANAEMQSGGIRHMKYTPLNKSSRFGFSIRNSSGQQLRFLQQNESGKDIICYIDDGERGALNFVASTTRIRNNAIIREGFNVQMEYAGMKKKNAISATTRKTLAIQISGHSWLPQVQADELGVKFEDLQSLNSVDNKLIHDWKIQNALKLVVEVTPLDGGRVLHLRSVFTIKNNTSHNINIYALEEEEEYSNNRNSEFVKDDPFALNISENFHVPLALLRRTASMSKGKNLGFLKIKPADLEAVEKELGPRSDIQYGVDVSYTSKSVDLMETITNTETWFSMLDKRHTDLNELQKIAMVQMGCTISPRLRRKKSVEEINDGPYIGKSSIISSSKLPPFCYNVEIQRIGDTNLINMQNTKVKQSLMQGLAGRLFRSKNHDKETKYRLPVHYNFVIHPPIILENLLPMSGTFEILHADQHRVLWSAVIKPGKAVPIHTVTLEEPLRLRINLSYCRTVDPQVRIHTPINKSKDQRTFVDKLQTTVEAFLDDNQDEDSSVELTDTVGQRLRLGIENIEGGGGQRHVTVYCPYWIVNLSQYSVRIREEGAPRDQLPAGTVTPNKDGTASVAYGLLDAEASVLAAAAASSESGSSSPGTPIDRPVPRGNGSGTIFPGKTPLFHSSRQADKTSVHGSLGRQIPKTSSLKSMLYDLHFDEIVDMAYMYNYPDNRITGKRRVLIQMDDSDWSEPISLDSVGTPFSVQVEHTERGHLELGYKIKMAPGRLGKYTKIVRMAPRFILDNRIDVPLRFTQPAGFMGETEQWHERAMVVKPLHYCPFHLSDMYTQRALSIQYEGPYSRTVFFRVEDIGTHTVKVNYALDLATVPHVNTRDAPEYSVIFPADKDIGLFLETDWGENNIVVREFKAGGFAYTETDMQLRDVIIAIDGEAVSGKTFDRALSLLTNRTKAVEVRVRTNEENIRRLRLAAVARVPEKNKEAKFGDGEKHADANPKILNKVLRLGIQQYEASIFISVEEIELQVKPEYKFMNTTTSHWLHYKQKGVPGNNWCSLAPGETIAYTWENPFLPHKLLTKAGRNVLSPRLNAQEENDFLGIRSNVLVNGLDCLTGVAIDDHAIMSISLDEIGGKHFQIALPDGSAGRLFANVAVAGSTKTLSIGPDTDMHLRELLYSTMFLDKQRLRLIEFRNMLTEFYANSFADRDKTKQHENDEHLADHQRHYLNERLLPQICEDREVVLEIVDHMENGIDVDRVLVSDSPVECVLGQHINKLHQIEIEVLEAKELRPFVIGKMEDVYVSVEIQHDLLRSDIAKEIIKGSLGLGRGQKKCTYMCEKNMNPSFIGQKFLFDVPAEAFDKKREFKVCVRVMCDSMVRAMDKTLGQSDIQFASLVKEEELYGWFPLRSTKKNITSSDNGMDIIGSIKLRVQWVHSSEGLAKSTLKCVNHRLAEVESQAKIQNEALMKLHDSNRNKNSNILSMLPQAREIDRLQAFSLMEAEDGTLFKDTDENLMMRLTKPNRGARPQSVSNAMGLLSDEWNFQDQGNHAASAAASKHLKVIDDSFSPSILAAAFETNNDEKESKKKIIRSNSTTLLKPMMDIDQVTPSSTPRRVDSKEGDLFDTRSAVNSLFGEMQSVTGIASQKSHLVAAPSATDSRHAKVVVKHKWPIILKTIIDSKKHQYKVSYKNPNTEMQQVEGTSTEHSHPLMAAGGGPTPLSLPKRVGGLTIQHPDQIHMHNAADVPPTSSICADFIEVMGRKSTSINCANSFVKIFDDECDRSHQHVHTQGGRLEVTPIKALHLPGSMKKSMFVRIIYGVEKKHTVSVKHAADLSWYHDNLSSDTYGENANPENKANSDDTNNRAFNEKTGVYEDENSPTKCFDIETLNIRSLLTIEVVDDSLFKKKVIAKLTIPILNLLDNLCGPEGEAEVAAMRETAAAAGVIGFDPQLDSIYNAWFPLTLSENAISSDGDIRSWNALFAEQLDYTKLPQGTPCIKLRFGWKKTVIDSSATQSNINISNQYRRFQLPYLSVAVVDSVKAREVLQWSIFSTEIRQFNTTKHSDLSLNVMWTQIDNQLPEQISPVLLAPTPMKHPQPTVRYHARKNNELSKDNLTSYDTVQAIVQTMDMRLEQQTVVATWALIKSWLQESQESISYATSSHGSSNKSSGKDHKESEKETPIDQLGFATCFDNVVYDLLPTLGTPSKGTQKNHHGEDNYNGDREEPEAEKMIYISFMNIGPIKINASFIMNPTLTGGGLSTQKRQTRASMSDDVDLKSSAMLFFSMVGDVALDITSSIADAPISFPVYKRNTIFDTENEVNKRMRQHYLYAALTQLYKIVGSLELVGNPIGLVSSVGTGVKDFFYEPSSAMITSPTEVGKITRGVLKGTMSLVGNTAEGLIGTSTTITRSFGRGVSKLSMDQTFIVAREALHRPARTLTEASMRPFKDIINGVYCGILGIVKVPYASFRRNPTLTGIGTAVTKGLAGLVAKPAVGVLDAVTHTGEALRETVRIITKEQIIPVHRVRFSNQFGPDGRMLPYLFSTALGTHILETLDRAASEGVGNVINEGRDFFTAVLGMCGKDNNKKTAVLNIPAGVLKPKTTPLAKRRASTYMMSPFFDKKEMQGAQPGLNDVLEDFIQDDANRGTDRVEFVIHAAIIPKSDENLSQLVIITTERVLVVDYIKRKRALSSFVQRWQESIHNLKAPLLERSGTGSITVVLGPKRDDEADADPASPGGGDEDERAFRKTSAQKKRKDDFVIESNYQEEECIIELYNCLIIVWSQGKLNIDQLETTAIKDGEQVYGEVVSLDEFGVYHIGPWEFKKDDDERSAHTGRNSQIYLIREKHLDKAKWYQDELGRGTHGIFDAAGGGGEYKENRPKTRFPTWLQEERRKAITCHTGRHDELITSTTTATVTMAENILSTESAKENNSTRQQPAIAALELSSGSLMSRDSAFRDSAFQSSKDVPNRSESPSAAANRVRTESASSSRSHMGTLFGLVVAEGNESNETIYEEPMRKESDAIGTGKGNAAYGTAQADGTKSITPKVATFLDIGGGSPSSPDIPDNESLTSRATNMTSAQADMLMNRLDSLEKLLMRLGIDKKLIDSAGTGDVATGLTSDRASALPPVPAYLGVETVENNAEKDADEETPAKI